MLGVPRRPSAIAALLLLAALAVAGGVAALAPRGPRPAAQRWSPLLRDAGLPIGSGPAEGGGGRVASSAESPGSAVPTVPERLGWLALGGGAEPSSNQVSLEQDLRLAREVLGPRAPGLVLFAGGPGSMVVELDRHPAADPLRDELAGLLDPRENRDARYRPSTLAVDGAATRPLLGEVLARALAERGAGPLLIYVAAHGNAADKARDDSVWLWGADSLSAVDLAALLDRAPAPRPALWVMSSCFSGGFAELIFAQADEAKGHAPPNRCGLFASTWDREAAGCDPNPNRRQQQSYGLFFLNALRRTDRDGRPLPAAAVDFDGDGQVSPLEAHARVRIAARSISVPTTTSERWLREAAPQTGAERPFVWPEESAVVAELGRALGLANAVAARARQATLDDLRITADRALEALERERDQRLHALQLRLLERWPELDDAWRTDFAATLTREHGAIQAMLDRSSEAQAYREAEDGVQRASEGYAELEEQLAMVDRLVRAHENLELAARLQARGGPPFDYFRQLLACERGWPGEGK